MNTAATGQTSCRRRILTIDDVPVFTRLIQLTLESTGAYEVATVNDSRKALNTARGFKPDLILLDIVMPLVNGNEVAALLEADPITEDIPIIFLSGYCPEGADNGKLFHFKGKRYLAKPVLRENLLETINGIFHEATA
ncbi:MAG: response regulator [Verrucomicrobiota bacterium]